MASGGMLASLVGVPTRTKLSYDDGTDTLTAPSVNLDQSGAASVSYLADSILNTDINWGTGSTEVSAEDMPIEDAGGYYSTDNVEAMGQEIGAQVQALASGIQIKMTVWSNPGGEVFDDADGVRQFQAVLFGGLGEVGTTFVVDDGTTTETWTGVSGTPGANEFDIDGPTINDMILSLVTRINADSALVKADYSLVADVDATNYLMFLGTQAIEAKIYTWGKKAAGGDWTNGQPEFSDNAMDAAAEFTALGNTDPDVMQFNVGVAQATLENGWAYPLRGGFESGAIYAYDQDDDQFTIFIPHQNTPIQAGNGITLNTTTDPDTVLFDEAADFTALTGEWTVDTGFFMDFSSADDDALRIPTGDGAPDVTTHIGSLYGDYTGDTLHVFLDEWHTVLGEDTNHTVTGTLTFNTGGAPFAVTGTTLVSNLNADLLDGVEGSGYATAAHMQANTAGGTAADSSAQQGATYLSTAGTWAWTGAIVAGDTFVGSAANTMAALAKGAAHKIFKMNSGATVQEWGDAEPAAGGTGIDSSAKQGPAFLGAAGVWDTVGAIVQGDMWYGSATDTMAALAAGSPGFMLYMNGGGTAPVWAAPPSGAIAFDTMNAPAGTDPVASVSQTLNFTGTGITVTGNSTTTTLDFAVDVALPASTVQYSGLFADGSGGWLEDTAFKSNAGAAQMQSADRTTAGAFNFCAATATSMVFGASDCAGDFLGNLTVATNKFSVAYDTGNTLVAGTLGVTGLATFSGGAIVPDSQNFTIGTGSDAVWSSDGANVLCTVANGNLTIDITGATEFFFLDLGTDTVATGGAFRDNSGNAIFEWFGDQSTKFTIDDTDPSFVITDTGGDIWFEVRPGADNKWTLGSEADNPGGFILGTGDLLLGDPVAGAETAKVVYLGLTRWTQIGWEVYCGNGSGVAIAQYENVKLITGTYTVQGSPDLTDIDNVVCGIAQTALGDGPGDPGWVAFPGGGMCYAHNGGLVAIAAGDDVYSKADGTIVGVAEIDIAVVIQRLGKAMQAIASDADGIINIQSSLDITV